MSRALLNKTLIQLFADEWHCIPSLVVIWPKANFKARFPGDSWDGNLSSNFWSWTSWTEHANTHSCMQVNRIYFKREKSTKLSAQTLSQYSSVAQSCPTLCNPIECSMLGFPVHHQLLELVQTHVLWVSDAIQPSHPLPSPSPPALNLSQHQGLFQWVSSLPSGGQSIGVSVQHQSFQRIFRVDFLYEWLVWNSSKQNPTAY